MFFNPYAAAAGIVPSTQPVVPPPESTHLAVVPEPGPVRLKMEMACPGSESLMTPHIAIWTVVMYSSSLKQDYVIECETCDVKPIIIGT